MPPKKHRKSHASSNNESDKNNDNEDQEPEQQHEDFYWNTFRGRIDQKDLEEAYNQIVYWSKNIFMVPTGVAGKNFIDEISRLLNLRTNNKPLKNIALKAIHVMPALLLKKPSKKLKAKDYLKALVRRLRLWEERNITELVNESNTIQSTLPSTNNQMNIEKLSSQFKQLMGKSNVNGALYLLTNNMSNETL